MKAVIFDISGRMAHFRRFYSSVTALSYYFPPRNTVTGLIAAILGYDRDSYYAMFSRKNLGVAVSINNKNGLRRLMLNTNYLDTDSVTLSKLRGKGKVPTAVEYVLPMPPETDVSYRIYIISLNHELDNIVDELAARMERREYAYPPSLGPANCLAYIELISPSIDAEILRVYGEEKISLPISTVIPYSIIPEDGLKFDAGKKIVLEERLPPDFADGRSIEGASMSYIFEYGGNAINITLDSRASEKIFKVGIEDRTVYGALM